MTNNGIYQKINNNWSLEQTLTYQYIHLVHQPAKYFLLRICHLDTRQKGMANYLQYSWKKKLSWWTCLLQAGFVDKHLIEKHRRIQWLYFLKEIKIKVSMSVSNSLNTTFLGIHSTCSIRFLGIHSNHMPTHQNLRPIIFFI